MTDRTLRNAIAAMLFCSVSIVAGAWTLKAAATVDAHQERMADALCSADPAWCGEHR
jgi:hypothetical protein